MVRRTCTSFWFAPECPRPAPAGRGKGPAAQRRDRRGANGHSNSDPVPLISPIARPRWVPFFSPLARGEDVRRTLLLLTLLFICMPSPAFAACAEDEATLFSCLAQDQQHSIELCAVRDDAAGGYQSLRYIYGTDAAQELSFPDDRRAGKKDLLFSHHFGKAGYYWRLRFSNKTYSYTVFGDPGDAGVEVFRKKKKLTEVICGERPVAYPDDIRRAAACDTDNDFGAAGCSESPPTAK